MHVSTAGSTIVNEMNDTSIAARLGEDPSLPAERSGNSSGVSARAFVRSSTLTRGSLRSV